MDIKKWLEARSIWEHKAPDDMSLLPDFEAGLGAGTTKEIASYAKGVYASNSMRGSNPVPITPRALGYFLTEHILSHSKYSLTPADGTSGSRLGDLCTWALGGKSQPGVDSVKRLYDSKPYDYVGPDQPSQFEWLLWMTACVNMDAKDPRIPKEDKLAEVAYLKEETKRVAGWWSHFKASSKTGDEVLEPSDRKAKNTTMSLLNNIFSVLNVPSTDRFFPEYNPDMLSSSVKTGIAFDESYQGAVSEDHFFDEPEDEPEPIQRDLTSAQSDLINKCHVSFFLFEKGYQIVSTLRYAKEQPGLRTVDPGKPLELPDKLAEELGVPKNLAYVRSTPGVKDPVTGKRERSYIYTRVENGKAVEGIDQQVVLDNSSHQKIRNATAPMLRMPSSVSAKEARYSKAVRLGRTGLVYKYITPENRTIQLDASQHKEVMKLNPEQVSMNIRGSVDHLFNDFFVEKVQPHYRQYMPDSREDRIALRDKVREAVDPKLQDAWDDIKLKSPDLEERTELAKKALHQLSRESLPEELVLAAPQLMKTMVEQNADALSEMVSQKAREKALVLYMEDIKGDNVAPNYKTYGLNGKFKTWAKQINSMGDSALDEHMTNAVAWAEKKFGSLEAMVPESHKVEKLTSHFQKAVVGELGGALEKRGIDMPKGLVGLAKEVNPLSISIFYDRRLTHLRWNFHLDKDLPEINLSRLAKEKNQPVPQAGPETQESASPDM